MISLHIHGGVDKLFMNRDTGTAGEITPLLFSWTAEALHCCGHVTSANHMIYSTVPLGNQTWQGKILHLNR